MAKKEPKWKQYIYTDSYRRLSSDMAKGAVDKGMLIDRYRHLYSVAQRRITAVQKSDLPYGKGRKPFFRKPDKLITEADVAHEFSDIAKFLLRANTTKSGRMAQFKKVQQSLKKQGFNVTKKNFNKFVNFMDWFYQSKYAALYDSSQDIVTEVFNKSGKTSASQWNRLFSEFQESGAFD